MSEQKEIVVQIKRCEGPGQQVYWEEFRLKYRPNLNVIALLKEIQKSPVNGKGEKVSPVTWDSSCLEEVCGACTMVINGKARQSCSALVDRLEQPIKLEPMTKFPLVRDLSVNRQKIFDDLKKVKAWVPVDGTYDLGPGPRMAATTALESYKLSTCMSCGCCLEACPQYSSEKPFVGAAVVSQVRLFNSHPTGAMHAHERLDAMMDEGGIEACGNSQNCVRVCPKEIPLTDSIATVFRDTAKHAWKSLFGG